MWRIYKRGAVAVSGELIAGVGTEAEIDEGFEARDTVDARGGIVYPGFIEVTIMSYTRLVEGWETSGVKIGAWLTLRTGSWGDR